MRRCPDKVKKAVAVSMTFVSPNSKSNDKGPYHGRFQRLNDTSTLQSVLIEPDIVAWSPA